MSIDHVVKISGKDFMAWFDAWEPATGYYWGYDLVRHEFTDPIHDDEGRWKVDPEKVYDLDDLGYVDREDLSLPEVDTYALISRWLDRRGKVVATILVGREAIKSFETLARKSGASILKAKPPSGSFSGADFMDWYERGFPTGYRFEEHEGDLVDDAGGWSIEADGVYDPHELGALLPDDEGLPDDKDLVKEIRRHLKERAEVPVTVLADPASVGRLRDMAAALRGAPA